MKYLIGAAIVAVVAGLIFGLAWLIQDEDRTCSHYADIVTAVGQHDPQDLRGVIQIYREACS